MRGTPFRRALLGFAAVFLLALGLRLLYLHQMVDGPLWNRPILDEAYNDAWASRIADGNGSPELPYFRAPLYPWLMGVLYRLWDPGPTAVRLAQALLSAISCVGIGVVARRVFRSGVAGISAGLACGFAEVVPQS